MNIIRDFFKTSRIVGAFWAFHLIVVTRLKARLLHKPHHKYYIPTVQKFFKKIFRDILINTKDDGISISSEQTTKKIWVLWWQGANDMPEVIKLCYESILRNANGFEVILIDQNNLSQYVTLPDYIYKKVEKKQISFSHLSDIIRLFLLTKHGGLWIDSAVYVTSPISFDDKFGFFSPNLHRNINSHSMGKWCISTMYSSPNNIYLQFVLNCILRYWEKYDAAFDYLFFDAIMRLCYNKFPIFKHIVDCQPNIAPDFHEARYTFNEEADINHLNKMLDDNMFLSLTWRISYPIVSYSNRPTYYGLLKSRSLNR